MKLRPSLTLLTESESVLKVVVNASKTTEKSLMIDMRASREAYHREEIRNFGWIRSEDNLVDGLHKAS